MPLVLPPPPQLSKEFQALNRWLLEIQQIFTSGGLIDPSLVVGLPATTVQVSDNTTDIGLLTTALQALTLVVAQNNATLQAQITALTARTTALETRSQVLNGVIAPAAGLGLVGDWYTDTALKHIYVKTGAATWTLIV